MLEPCAQRQLGGMQEVMRRCGKLKAALAAGTLIVAWSRPAPPHVAACNGNCVLVAAGGAYPNLWPYLSLENAPTLSFITERSNHFFNGLNLGQHSPNGVRYRTILGWKGEDTPFSGLRVYMGET